MKTFFRITDGIILAVSACCLIPFIHYGMTMLFIPVAVIYAFINIFPSFYNLQIKSFRLRICAEGSDLLCSFLIGATAAVIYHIFAFAVWYSVYTEQCWISSAIAVLSLGIVFWNGIIRVYCTSIQLGIKHRVIGLLCGCIPLLNLWALSVIIRVTSRETEFEYAKAELNKRRAEEQICKTKYPLLMVHGVFFRDCKHINYWGRIPDELRKNGAVVYYGNHQSALSVADSGKELAERIKQIAETTGCGKVNIIAHSKGGLDSRYAISCCGAEKYVASLTTISTPHRGCKFVDWLLSSVPKSVQNSIAHSYNFTLRKLGETPDFLTATSDLTDEGCRRLNDIMPDKNDILYQSVGSRLNRAVNGKFPMNFSYNFVKHFSGENDGLVAKNSFAWGSSFTYLTINGKRGISHADIIDLNRENIPGFDVREFYVQLAANLKSRGY